MSSEEERVEEFLRIKDEEKRRKEAENSKIEETKIIRFEEIIDNEKACLGSKMILNSVESRDGRIRRSNGSKGKYRKYLVSAGVLGMISIEVTNFIFSEMDLFDSYELGEVGIDLEFEPSVNKLVLMQIAVGNKVVIIKCSEMVNDNVRELLESSKIKKYFHSAISDIPKIVKSFGIMPNGVYDIQIEDKILNELSNPRNIEELSALYIGYRHKKTKSITCSDWSFELNATQVLQAGLDAFVTKEIGSKMVFNSTEEIITSLRQFNISKTKRSKISNMWYYKEGILKSLLEDSIMQVCTSEPIQIAKGLADFLSLGTSFCRNEDAVKKQAMFSVYFRGEFICEISVIGDSYKEMESKCSFAFICYIKEKYEVISNSREISNFFRYGLSSGLCDFYRFLFDRIPKSIHC